MPHLKNILLRGIVFLIPVGFLGIILAQFVKVTTSVAKIADQIIPIERVAGVALTNILVILFLFLTCVVAGLISYLSVINDKVIALDKILAQNMPGYTFVKGLFGSATKNDDAFGTLDAVFVHLQDRTLIAFEVERAGDQVILFKPTIPTILSGEVIVASASQVEPIDLPAHQFLGALQNHGQGLEKALAKVVKVDNTPKA